MYRWDCAPKLAIASGRDCYSDEPARFEVTLATIEKALRTIAFTSTHGGLPAGHPLIALAAKSLRDPNWFLDEADVEFEVSSRGDDEELGLRETMFEHYYSTPAREYSAEAAQ